MSYSGDFIFDSLCEKVISIFKHSLYMIYHVAQIGCLESSILAIYIHKDCVEGD